MSQSRHEFTREQFFNGIPEVYRKIENWPSVHPDTISDIDVRKRLERLTKATSLFLKSESFESVLKVALVGERQFFALMSRALSPAKHGSEINGTRAYVSHKVQPSRNRTKPYAQSKDQGGFSGLFRKLLKDVPKIEIELKEYLDGKARPNKVTPHLLHRKFLDICTANDISGREYPFNTQSQGSKPLKEWYQQVYIPANLMKHMHKQHGRAAAIAAGYELGDGQSKTPPLPYRGDLGLGVVFSGLRQG